MNNQIEKMKEMIMNAFHVVAKNLNNKEELLEKLNQIEEIEPCKLSKKDDLIEEDEEGKLSKRKSACVRDNQKRHFNSSNLPHMIGATGSCNQCMLRI